MSLNFIKKVADGIPFYEGNPSDFPDLPAKTLLAFIPFFNNPSATFPEQLSVKDSWNKAEFQGTYIFLKFEEQADFAKMIRGVQSLRSQPAREHLRFLWISSSDANFPDWKRQEIHLNPATNRLEINNFWDFRNYSIFLPSGTKVSWSTRKKRFIFEAQEKEAQSFKFRTNYGASEIGTVSPEIQLPFSGKEIACLQFALILTADDFPSSEDEDKEPFVCYPGLKDLDISLRMFFRDPSLPGDSVDFSLESLRYPLFNEILQHPLPTGVEKFYPDRITFGCQLDWLNPELAERSFLKLLSPLPHGLASGYRTNMGLTIHLRPKVDNHSLVFTPLPAHSKDNISPALYLSPKGKYELIVPNYDPDSSRSKSLLNNLVCGLSGVEYIRINEKAQSLLVFNPGESAFVRNFKAVSSLRNELLELISQHTEIPLASHLDPTSSQIPLDPEDLFDEIKFEADHPRVLAGEAGEDEAKFGNTERLAGTYDILVEDFFEQAVVLSQKLKSQLINDEQVADGVDTPEKLLSWMTDRLRETRPIHTPLELDNLDGIAQTSWSYIVNPEKDAPVYYSQPDQSVLYQDTTETGNDVDPQDEFLAFMEVPTYRLLPSIVEEENKIPIFPYGGGIDIFYLEDVKQMEEGFVSPLRQEKIQLLDQEAKSQGKTEIRELPKAKVENPKGTTPQGFIATYGEASDSKSFERIASLEIAKGTDKNAFKFTNIDRESILRAALLSNQLFMVASNPDSLRPFLKQNSTDDKLDIDSWVFSMNPELWDEFQTIIIFKFHNQPMLDLAKNTFAWSQPLEFSHNSNKSMDATQLQIIEVLQDAVEKVKEGTKKDKEKYGKLAQAALEPAWSGILVLKARIFSPPKSVAGLMAGVKPEEFFAKYIGVEMTPVKPVGDDLISDPSSTFGLIDYEDNSLPPPNDSGYNFQVTKLFARFENASLVDFSSELAVTIDKLFDERTKLRNSPDGRNVVIMIGTVELHEGEDIYTFQFQGDQEFDLPHSNALRSISIHQAEFITDPAPVGSRNLTSRFLFKGGKDFKPLSGFDILSFGEENTPAKGQENLLIFSHLQVIMQTQQAPEGTVSPPVNSFRFDSGKMAFDLRESNVRKESLFAKFPLKFTGFQFSGVNLGESKQGKIFTDLGFMPVEIVTLPPLIEDNVNGDVEFPPPPIKAPKAITDKANAPKTWYALTFDLDLGTAGDLAGSIGLTASICAAWIPEGMQPSALSSPSRGVFVGLKLPGSTGGKREIELQGLLKLVFKKIQFVTGKNDKGELAYLLKLKNIVLKFLVLSLPPSAQSEIIIFGDPNQLSSTNVQAAQDQKKLVGWYASFVKK